MSKTRDLATNLKELLKEIVPSGLFEKNYIGSIVVVCERSVAIHHIENSVVANMLWNCLKLDEYGPNYNGGIFAPQIAQLGYKIISGHFVQLAEKLSQLSQEEKTKLSNEMTEYLVKNTSAGASKIVEGLTRDIKKHGLENATIAVKVRQMKDALKNPPKTLEDVFIINDCLKKLSNSCEDAIYNKAANTAEQKSFAPKATQ
jgi:hypothetical protein